LGLTSEKVLKTPTIKTPAYNNLTLLYLDATN